MYCENCGERILKEMQFCPNCGKRVGEQEDDKFCEETSASTEKDSNSDNNSGFGIEIRSSLISTLVSFAIFKLLQGLGFRTWVLIVAVGINVYFFSALVSKIVIWIMSETILNNRIDSWVHDDWAILISFFWFLFVTILLNAYGINNFFAKLCIIIVICLLVAVIEKFVKILKK